SHKNLKSKIQDPKSDVGDSYFPSAGIPWYVCPFGRDSLITALQTLSLNPQIAVGTLRVLARYQGMREDPWREEEPGKILHELRMGEMARLGMVPHSPYYGSVDSTPLFVLLFVETMSWLDNNSLYDELLPNVLRAVEWIDKYGDVDGDGLIEYREATSPGGIRNQVWKDSGDSTQFPDGTLAETPFAAAEVQAYVYAAKKGLGELLRRKGDAITADRLIAEAEALRTLFNSAFWMEESGFFSQGLDHNKVKVPTITSNPGHCLWCGIADDDKAKQTVQRMIQPDMLSGWGLRTISEESPSYNPMSYHNGSVWPHDNSIGVAGFKRYGYGREANRVITQIYEAAQHFRYMRLPELYCGFASDIVDHTGPTEYPVSCNPQAWAAAAPILMLQTMLGLEAYSFQDRLVLNPRLPDWLTSVQIDNLRVGEKRVGLRIDKHGDHCEASLTHGDMSIGLEIT
ncbi:MAG: amylo-alpha-1,6-glucosidase, partial [Chloroflexia bacterium]